MSKTRHARPPNAATARRHQSGSKRSQGGHKRHVKQMRPAGNHGSMTFRSYVRSTRTWNVQEITVGDMKFGTVISIDDWNKVTVALGGGLSGVLVAVAREADTKLAVEVGDRIRVRILSVNTEEQSVRLQYLARSTDLTSVTNRDLRTTLAEHGLTAFAVPTVLSSVTSNEDVEEPVAAVTAIKKERVSASPIDKSQIGDLLDFRRKSTPDALRLLALIGDATKRHDVAVRLRSTALRGCMLREVKIVRETGTARRGHTRAVDCIAHFSDEPLRLWPSDVSFVLIRFLSRLNDVLPKEICPHLKRYVGALGETKSIEASRCAAISSIDYCVHVALPNVLERQGLDLEVHELRRLPPLSPTNYYSIARILRRLGTPAINFMLQSFDDAEGLYREGHQDAAEHYAFAASSVIDLAQEQPRAIAACALLECFDNMIEAAKHPQFVIEKIVPVVKSKMTVVVDNKNDLAQIVQTELKNIRTNGASSNEVFSAPLKAAFAALAMKTFGIPQAISDFDYIDRWRRVNGALVVPTHLIDRVRERAPICASMDDNSIRRMITDIVKHGALDDHWIDGEKRVWGAFLGVELCIILARETNPQYKTKIVAPTVLTQEQVSESEGRRIRRASV